MTAFTTIPDGFRVAPGRYALIAQDWSGSVGDPRVDADRMNEICLPAGDGPRIAEFEGMALIVLPMGLDDAGCPGRSFAVGSDSMVAFENLVLVDVEMAQRRAYRYASHLNEIVVLEFERGGEIRPVDGAYDLRGCTTQSGALVHSIDTAAVGAFSIDGLFVDMTDPATAQAFGYGTAEFNAKLDEHGFHADLDAVRTRLRARTDHDGIALLNRLEKMGASMIAYYAPVAD